MPAALNPRFAEASFDKQNTAIVGKEKAQTLLNKMNLSAITVHEGRDYINAQNQTSPSPAAMAIVKEVMRDDPLPLAITIGGPLTNLAEALKLKPEIANKMEVVWIGGGDFPSGGWEYNLSTDINAAKYVFEQSQIPVTQIPVSAYRQMQYSVAEMRVDFRPLSDTTRWLYSLYTELPDFVEMGGSLTMVDHPLVLLTALSTESSYSENVNARAILPDSAYGEILHDRSIKVYTRLDARLTFADFLNVEA